MKIYKVLSLYINSLKHVKYSLLIPLFVIVLIMIVRIKQLLSVDAPFILSVWDYVSGLTGGGTANAPMLVYVVIPLFTFMIVRYIDGEEVPVRVIKHVTRKRLWDKHVLFIVYLSLVISFIVVCVGYLLSGIMIEDFSNEWTNKSGAFYYFLKDKENFEIYAQNLTTLRVMLILFLVKFFSLVTLGTLIALLKAIIHNNVLIYMMIIMYSLVEGYFPNFSFIITRMAVTGENWKNISSIFENQFYLLLSFVFFYFVGKVIYRKKDFSI
ncbi:TPA: hypothetical protein ROX88_002049 [Bacillus pseudomycoides]|nr:hypothetical protein [Bacillus pseudomycoides]